MLTSSTEIYLSHVVGRGFRAERYHSKRYYTKAENLLNKLARFAGLVWKRRQTGKSESEDTHLVRECDKYLRYYLVEAANSLRVHNETWNVVKIFQRFLARDF